MFSLIHNRSNKQFDINIEKVILEKEEGKKGCRGIKERGGRLGEAVKDGRDGVRQKPYQAYQPYKSASHQHWPMNGSTKALPCFFT